MSQFPIILIPDAIQQTKVAQPPIPKPPNLPLPRHPGDAPAKINRISIGIQSAIAVVLSFVIGSIVGNNLIGTLLLIGGLGAIAFSTWQKFNNYSQRKKEHQERVAIYRRQKEEVELQKRLHYEEVQKLQTPAKIAEFRHELLLNVLSGTIANDGKDDDDEKIGSSERAFRPYLKKYFGDKIDFQLTLNIPNFPYPYSTDFAYIDKNSNLHIDIELDEPYAYKSRQPIHYLGSSTEERRNHFFLEKGWIVIRFSEKQIVKYPESCCKVIAETIASVLNDNSILSQFKHILSLPKMKQWTYYEAEAMAMTEYRKTYLNEYCN